MPIEKQRLVKDFTQMPNAVSTDDRLSDAAVRVMLYLLSKSASWSIQVPDLMKQLKYSRSKVYGALADLINAGYMKREDERKGGRFKGSVYTLYNVPLTVSVNSSHGDASTNPTHGKAGTQTEKPRPVSTDTAEPQLSKNRVLDNIEDEKEKEKKESLARESQPQTEEREIDLPFAIRSRINSFANYERNRAALLKEIERLGAERAVAILEERCFGRPEVRDWSYMVTALRREPPLEDEFVAIMQASAKTPVPVEVESSAPPVAPKAEAPAPATPAPKPVEPVLPAAKPKPLAVEAAPVDELSPEHDWHAVRRALFTFFGAETHPEAHQVLTAARFGGYEKGVFTLVAPDEESRAQLEKLDRLIEGNLKRLARNFASDVKYEVQS